MYITRRERIRKMIDTLSNKMASSIKKHVPDHPASQAVLKYALAIILNITLIIGLTLGISLLTGKTMEAGTLLISFALLRQVTGGLHLKSGTVCVLFTTSLFTTLSFITVDQVYTQIMNGLSLTVVLWLAPIGIEKQTRIPKRHYPKLRVIAVILILVNVIVGSPVIAASYFAQSVSLILARKGVKK